MDEGDDESATARGERNRRRDDDNVEDPLSQATQLGTYRTQDSMLVNAVVLDSDILVGTSKYHPHRSESSFLPAD